MKISLIVNFEVKRVYFYFPRVLQLSQRHEIYNFTLNECSLSIDFSETYCADFPKVFTTF